MVFTGCEIPNHPAMPRAVGATFKKEGRRRGNEVRNTCHGNTPGRAPVNSGDLTDRRSAERIDHFARASCGPVQPSNPPLSLEPASAPDRRTKGLCTAPRWQTAPRAPLPMADDGAASGMDIHDEKQWSEILGFSGSLIHAHL